MRRLGRAAWVHDCERDADLSANLSERVTLGPNLDGELSAKSNRLGGSAQLRVSF
ncbi:hypothetical protein AB4099_21395 [Bosea sp. 2KB_26]|uniref:hypothetical protein n=1 Tax=Bosea sp. 2KB_26 TaxID=3237475 RepID=UPI0013AFF0FA